MIVPRPPRPGAAGISARDRSVAVHRCARLLSPRFRKRAGIERIEPGVFDQGHADAACCLAIGGHRDGDAVRAPSGFAIARERVRTDRIPRLDDRASQLFCYPSALDLATVDVLDPACPGAGSSSTVSMTTVSAGTSVNSGATSGIRCRGMDRITTSTSATASAAVTARPPNERTSTSMVFGPRELATFTSCPAALNRWVSVVADKSNADNADLHYESPLIFENFTRLPGSTSAPSV